MKVLYIDCLWIFVIRMKFLRFRGFLCLGMIFFDIDLFGLELWCSICFVIFDLGDIINEKLNVNYWVLFDWGMVSVIFL